MNQLILFIRNLVYNSRRSTISLILILVLLMAGIAQGAELGDEIPMDYEPVVKFKNWKSFEDTVTESYKIERLRGKSELWTGGLALTAGLIGDTLAKDPMEKVVYTLFQSIGIASVGVGLYDMSIGDENRRFYLMLKKNKGNFTESQLNQLVVEFNKVNSFYERREKKIKMYTFGIMAMVQFYNASRVSNESVKNSLMFLGSINGLVSLNYAF